MSDDTGERKNKGKLRWRNFPLFLLEDLIAVGSTAEKREDNPKGKYDTFNFLKGMKVNDCLDSAKRHLMKAESPYHSDYDEESEVHHLAHAAWNCLVALHNIKTRPDLDDRFKVQKPVNTTPDETTAMKHSSPSISKEDVAEFEIRISRFERELNANRKK